MSTTDRKSLTTAASGALSGEGAPVSNGFAAIRKACQKLRRDLSELSVAGQGVHITLHDLSDVDTIEMIMVKTDTEGHNSYPLSIRILPHMNTLHLLIKGSSPRGYDFDNRPTIVDSGHNSRDCETIIALIQGEVFKTLSQDQQASLKLRNWPMPFPAPTQG